MGVPNEGAALLPGKVGGTAECPISQSLEGCTFRRARFSKAGLMAASCAAADPFAGMFVPRCGIRDGEGEDKGRGVVGGCEGDSPSVCFFAEGNVPECCFEADQFTPETGGLEGAGGRLVADRVWPKPPAFPRCCLATCPLPGCWPGVNV
jgi:hypothetical protein